MKCDCFIIIFYGEKTMDLFEYAKSKTLDQESPPRQKPFLNRKGLGTKKSQTLRSDLEEAATYSPTGKPQYHRRK